MQVCYMLLVRKVFCRYLQLMEVVALMFTVFVSSTTKFKVAGHCCDNFGVAIIQRHKVRKVTAM